ncbi:caspase family protein [Neolewinella litorea]|uniref:Peptidase C14 caspase domain-containing protein n=1 Tax=Neolewinella litorea TaxID=2562452 RepID=A0A4S4NN20_9BACT|nr:caspase family protein [Neolewinella litorea]THH39781.1 hypothetical protein E4021_09205 [Neolewinella litorea]
MRLLFLLGCGLFLTVLSGQQTLHVITTINPHPADEIAQGCQVDARNVDKLFNYVAESLARQGIPMQVRRHNPGFTPNEVSEFLEGFYVEPEDAVFFLYSGHGLADPEAPRWPLLYYCAEGNGVHDAAGCGVSLWDVHESIKQSGARMSVTVGSSCNAEPEGAASTGAASRRTEFAGEDNDGGRESTHYGIDLFTDFRGHILATSARPGQIAYLNDAIGSYYVDALVNTLAEALQSDREVSWPSILRRTDKVVRQHWKKEQEAHFMVNRGDSELYSDPDIRYPGEGEVRALEESYYTADWEAEEDRAEAIELLPYLLVDIAYRVSTGEEDFDARLDAIESFYEQLLAAHYPEGSLEDLYLALTDLEEDPEWFEEETDYAGLLYAELSGPLRESADQFIQSLAD